MNIKHYELPSMFLLGGTVYMGLEMLWRGYTHWSMGICGGICFLGIYLFEVFRPDCSLMYKCLFGSGFITLNEFITGCIVNLVMGWNIWDYSGYIFNLFGQICMLYSGLWFLLSIPAFKLSRLIRNKLFCKTKILHSAE